MLDQKPITQIRIQPTLYLIVGTTSGQIGWRVKKELQQAFGKIPVLRFLWVDIDTAVDPKAKTWFSAAERVELSGFDPAAVIKNIDHYEAIKQWWPEKTRVQAGLLAGGGSPQQMRLVGRLALFRMFNDRTRGPALIDRLKAATEALFEIENIRATEAMSNERMQFTVEGGCRVVIIFTPCGGSGSAMSFDLAYLCRHLLQGKNPTVISINVLPPVIDRAIQNETHTQKEKIRANTYAWFKEDNYLSEHPYWNLQYPEGAPAEVHSPPFDYRYVIGIENQAGYRLNSPEDVYDMVAHSIFMDTGSSIGGALRGFTANVAALGDTFEGARRSFSSIAAASLVYPKERLLEYCSARLGRTLLLDGLLAAPNDHQVGVAAATILAQLRLSDVDLLNDLLENTQVQMLYETAIQKADSVSAALVQIDKQEIQNQTARAAQCEQIEDNVHARLEQLIVDLDRSITHQISLRGLPFALAVLRRLTEPAQPRAAEAAVLSLDGQKMRLAQQGYDDKDLEEAGSELARARKAVYQLDDGLEDRLERIISLRNWNKKFALYKRDCLTAMSSAYRGHATAGSPTQCSQPV